MKREGGREVGPQSRRPSVIPGLPSSRHCSTLLSPLCLTLLWPGRFARYLGE